jgi:transcriptional regulator with XRE-family HTH domain
MALSSLTKQSQRTEATLAVEVGQRIRAARLASGMSQARLGDPLTRAYVSQVESGQTLPSLTAFLHLADRLGIDPCLLLPSRGSGRRQYTRTHASLHSLGRAPSG